VCVCVIFIIVVIVINVSIIIIIIINNIIINNNNNIPNKSCYLMLRVVVGCQISNSSITNCILISDIMTVQEDSCQQNEIQQSEKKTSDHQSSRIHTDVDGFYAWIIAMTSFFGHLMVYGILYSSGVFYEMFREIFDGSSSVFSLIASLSTAFTFGFSK